MTAIEKSHQALRQLHTASEKGQPGYDTAHNYGMIFDTVNIANSHYTSAKVLHLECRY